MSTAARRAATLAAVLAPGRAPRLLGHLPPDEAGPARAAAAALATSPRRARLAALAAALMEDEAGPPPAPGLHPLLARLEREVRAGHARAGSPAAGAPGTARSAAARTPVRAAADLPPPSP